MTSAMCLGVLSSGDDEHCGGAGDGGRVDAESDTGRQCERHQQQRPAAARLVAAGKGPRSTNTAATATSRHREIDIPRNRHREIIHT